MVRRKAAMGGARSPKMGRSHCGVMAVGVGDCMSGVEEPCSDFVFPSTTCAVARPRLERMIARYPTVMMLAAGAKYR